MGNGNTDTELSTLIQNAQETAIQIDQLINSARRSRVLESCSVGLVNGQASTGAESNRNSCNLGASSDSCGKGENVAEAELSHSEIMVTGGRKKKNIF